MVAEGLRGAVNHDEVVPSRNLRIPSPLTHRGASETQSEQIVAPVEDHEAVGKHIAA